MKKTIFLIFLLNLKIAYAFDYSVFYTDPKYSAPIIVLFLFFILFFLFRKRFRKHVVVKKTEEPEQPLIKPMVHRLIPEERIITKRPGKWKREMKFTFTNFQGFPGKDHIHLKKKSGVFDKLSRIIKPK